MCLMFSRHCCCIVPCYHMYIHVHVQCSSSFFVDTDHHNFRKSSASSPVSTYVYVGSFSVLATSVNVHTVHVCIILIAIFLCLQELDRSCLVTSTEIVRLPPAPVRPHSPSHHHTITPSHPHPHTLTPSQATLRERTLRGGDGGVKPRAGSMRHPLTTTRANNMVSHTHTHMHTQV